MEALISIQEKLEAPKGQYNSFGKYKYRSCEDILSALKPVLAEEKAYLTLSDEVVQIGERFYVKATATLYAGKESVSVSSYAREAQTKKGMDEAQITGAASSYARKYALNGLFAIDDTKDADATNTHGKENTPPARPRQRKPSGDKAEKFMTIFDKAKGLEDLSALWRKNETAVRAMADGEVKKVLEHCSMIKGVFEREQKENL